MRFNIFDGLYWYGMILSFMDWANHGFDWGYFKLLFFGIGGDE